MAVAAIAHQRTAAIGSQEAVKMLRYRAVALQSIMATVATVA